MNYLKEYGFTVEEINHLEKIISDRLQESLTSNYKLVCQNLTYLKELGVTNLKEIFVKYYDLFLIDYSSFTSIFKKYDPQDLVEKLQKNVEIIDFL